LAILTKRRAFWFLGSAVIGLAVAMTGQMGVMLGDHGHAVVEHKSH